MPSSIKFIISLILLAAICITATSSLTGCSPLYVVSAAYQEGKILIRRKEIPSVIKDPDTPNEIREKLLLVTQARTFANSIGLDTGDSYTQYSQVEKDVLAWVLLACKKDAFEPYTWWYPVVGTVPYKGFFEKKDAECDVRRLSSKGYEVWIRGTEAFSTLGWFNDPILTTTLKHQPHEIVNTVLHELFHQTIWIPGSVEFNESAANVIGGLGAIAFFEEELTKCENDICREQNRLRLQLAEQNWEFEKTLGDVLTEVKGGLETLYHSDISREEKLRQRDTLFLAITEDFRKTYPKATVFQKLNNAAILQLYIYRRALQHIEQRFLSCKKEWNCFLQVFRDIAQKNTGKPFQDL